MKIVRVVTQHFIKHFTILLWGGFIYYLIELAWRGRSHPSMFLVGGLCLVIVGGINNYIPWKMNMWLQLLIGTGVITVVEFIAGVIINLWMNLNVWDYSNLPLEIKL